MQDTGKARQVLSPTSLTVAGLEDGSFKAFQRSLDNPIQHTPLCLTIFQGSRLTDVRLARITVDGDDATDTMFTLLNNLEPDVLILGGATFGGFNVVYTENVYKKTGIPIIVFSAKKPNVEATLNALRKHFPDWEKRWTAYTQLGEIYSLDIGDYPTVYYEKVGCSEEFAERVLIDQALTGRTPEAVRVAGLIAKGLSSSF